MIGDHLYYDYRTLFNAMHDVTLKNGALYRCIDEGMILDLPTADVVEVVRCKDCKHADKFYHCTYMNKWNTADGFCYCGERKDDE